MNRSSLKQLFVALSLILSPFTMADVTPLFKFSAGAGSWSTEFSGAIGLDESLADLDELGLEDTSNTFFYAQFEHPVPFIPNLRVDHTSISTSGTGILQGEFTLGDDTFSENTEVSTEMDLTMLDGILYYEIAILDFGLNFRQFDFEIVTTEVATGEMAEEKVDGVIPMVFLQADVDLPLTGLYVLGNVNLISYDDKSITDYRAAVGYKLDISILSEIGFELGYRSFEIELGEDDDINGDVEMSGVYFGANITF